MKLLGSILIFLFCTLSLFGQNATLTGTLMDKSDNQPIIAGSITLLQVKDSAFVAGTVSNDNGAFFFKQVAPGNYVLKITYLGYNTLTKNIGVRAEQSNLNVGKLYLEANSILLQETIVEGKKPEVIVKNDTIEYDAASFKVTENAVVEDLLKKLPGVEVDKDGKITANGKEIKKIMVDGKEFFSDDPQVASKNLPAEMIEKLQVVDRKSDMARMTGFDDGEEETILNLTVRQGMKKGTMGNALLGAGSDLAGDKELRYQAGAFLNNMRNSDRYTLIVGQNNNNNMGAADLGANRFGGMRIRRDGNSGITESTNFMFSMNKAFSPVASLNGDIRYNASDRLSKSRESRLTTLSETATSLDSTETNNTYLSDNFSANFTFEWKPDSSNTLIIRPNIRHNCSNSDDDIALSRYSNGVKQYTSKSISDSRGEGWELGGTLDYAHKFGKLGRVLSVNARANYNTNYSWENSDTDYEGDVTPSPDLNQRDDNNNNTANYRMTVSYVEPVGKNNFLQALYRISYYDTKNINSTYDLDNPVIGMAVLNDSLSRSTLRKSSEQRFGLNFKAVREKYNGTFGINYDPVHSVNETYQPTTSETIPYQPDKRLETRDIRNDELLSSVPLTTPNISPVVNFNYIFSQRNNLRIEYDGETIQPSVGQLRDYEDKSNPTQWVKGNPELKSGYEHELRIRYNRYIPETQLMYNLNLNGNYRMNDITEITIKQDNIRNMTSYENVNGNWDIRLRGMFNLPLRNKRFTVGNFTNIAYSRQNSFVAQQSEERLIDKKFNTRQNFTLSENANINYRSDLFDLGMSGNLNYSHISYSLQTRDTQRPLNWGMGVYTTWYLPHNLTFESDFNWTLRSGYEKGLNLPERMWNAAVTKQIFNKKFGTGSLKLQIFDILQDRKSITTSSITNGYRISEVNVIPRYFMCSFIYKFTAFPKSGAATEDDLRPRMRFGGPMNN